MSPLANSATVPHALTHSAFPCTAPVHTDRTRSRQHRLHHRPGLLQETISERANSRGADLFLTYRKNQEIDRWLHRHQGYHGAADSRLFYIGAGHTSLANGIEHCR